MAELQLEGGELVLHLSGVEKAEAVHGDLRVPLSAIRGVEVLDETPTAGPGSGPGSRSGCASPASPRWPLSTAMARRMSQSTATRPAACGCAWRVPPGMSGSSAAQIPKPSPPPWRQRAAPAPDIQKTGIAAH